MSKSCEKSLYEYSHLDGVWEGVILPWVRGGSEILAKRVIVGPNNAFLMYLKERLVKAGENLFGVEFLTGSGLRQRLVGELGIEAKMPLREDLHLLVRVVVDEIGGESMVGESVRKDPELVVKLFDKIDGAKWRSGVIKDEEVRRYVERFEDQLEEYAIGTQKGVESEIEERAEGRRVFEDMLVVGFGSQNWRDFGVLNLGLGVSERGSILLRTTDSAQVVDEVWLGSWEERYGGALRIEGAEESPYEGLAQSFEFKDEGRGDVGEMGLEVSVAETIEGERNLVVRRVCELLEVGSKRVAVVFPKQTHVLGRLVGEELRRLGIYHNDHLGHPPGIGFKQRLFNGWLRAAESCLAEDFLAYLRLLVEGALLGTEEAERLEKRVVGVYREVMTQDMGILLEALGGHWYDGNETLRGIYLKERGTFREFFEAAREYAEVIGWPEEASVLETRAGTLGLKLESKIGRNNFIAWLRGVCTPMGRIKPLEGAQSFAKVHLLTVEQALGQDWTDVIVTSLVRGDWPKEHEESILLGDKCIREENAKNISQGNQGEGHFVYSDGANYMLGTGEEFYFEERNFCDLLRQAKEKLILTTHLKDEENFNRDKTVSDFLQRVYWIAEGEILTRDTQEELVERDRVLCEKLADGGAELDESERERIERVYRDRNDPEKAFDEYMYCFKGELLEGGIKLPAKAWEDALVKPQEIWMKHILKVEPRVDFGESLLSLGKGIWVHDWVAVEGAEDKPKEVPKRDEWLKVLEKKAESERARVEGLYSKKGRRLPAWWISQWAEARNLARDFIMQLGDVEGYEKVLSEYSLPEELKLRLRCIDFSVTGRVDMVLIREDSAWVIDFKTGGRTALTKKRMERGEGLQLGIYALALEQQLKKDIQVTILSEKTRLKEQVSFSEIMELEQIWSGLAEILRHGQFGCRSNGVFQNGARQKRPLAEIKIDENILERKWGQTHRMLIS